MGTEAEPALLHAGQQQRRGWGREQWRPQGSDKVRYACWERVAVQGEVVARMGAWPQAAVSATPGHPSSVLGERVPGCPVTFRLLKWRLEAELALGFSPLTVGGPNHGRPPLCSRDEGP